MAYTQWSASEGTFTPVDNTLPAIDPGYYDLTADQSGRVYFTPVRPRTDDLLRFPDSASLAVLEGIADFWDREARFAKYDLPFKRGILLYGPPGSGKTCTLQLIAKDVVQRGGIVLTFPGSTSLFLAAYRALRDIQPETPIVVLMEDFEATVKKVDESRLLNLLDGVERLHKCVFLATTNYPELLESRIMNRPSRFDVLVRVDHPSEDARRLYMTSLLHDGDDLDVEAYVRDTHGLSLAHVKELFVATHILGGDYAVTVKRLKTMKEGRASSKDDGVAGAAGWFGFGPIGQYL